jgi:protein gp37
MAHNPKLRDRFTGLVKDGDWTGVVRTLPENLDWPLHRRKPLRIGVDFYADLFHESVPD